jgi:hypothetical protein
MYMKCFLVQFHSSNQQGTRKKEQGTSNKKDKPRTRQCRGANCRWICGTPPAFSLRSGREAVVVG